MRDFLRFGGEDRAEEVPCGLLSALLTYAEAHTLAWETALSCPFLNENILGTSPPRILCGILCVLAERTEMKGFLVVRVPEGCLQPEEIRRGSGRKQKTRLRAVSRKPRVSLCGELLVKNEYGQEFANACDYRGYPADVRAYGKNERVLNVSANERH